MVDVGDGSGDKLVYGVFTTGDNALSGSAVCAFRLSEIKDALEESPFKGQSGPNANWLPVRDEPVQEGGQKPGQFVVVAAH